MGALFCKITPSSPSFANDYERVIRASKELEWLLELLGASGRGLHEKLSSIQLHLPPSLVRQIRYVATIRNRIIHERGFDNIPDPSSFNLFYERSCQELHGLMQRTQAKLPPAAPIPSILALCSIM